MCHYRILFSGTVRRPTNGEDLVVPKGEAAAYSAQIITP